MEEPPEATPLDVPPASAVEPPAEAEPEQAKAKEGNKKMKIAIPSCLTISNDGRVKVGNMAKSFILMYSWNSVQFVNFTYTHFITYFSYSALALSKIFKLLISIVDISKISFKNTNIGQKTLIILPNFFH